MQNTRPLLQAAKAHLHRRSCICENSRPPKLIHHPTYRAQILSRRCEEVHPVPGQDNGHDRAREGRIFGTDPRVNIWPFGLSTAAEGLLERLRSATARPGRLWYASAWLRADLGMADPCSFCASGYCPAQRPPPRAKRAHARLARLKVRARLPRCPLTPLTPPRTRTARPKRKHRGPHTRGALGAALALHARRAPVGRCELKAGGRAAARPPEAPPAAATAAHGQPSVPWAAGRPPMGRRAPPRLARAARYTVCDLSGFVCVERGFYTFTAYELLQTGPLYHMDTALCSWADPTGSGRRLGHTYRPRSLRGLHGDGASSWSPQRPFIGVFGERAAWLMMTEHGPTLEGTTYRQ